MKKTSGLCNVKKLHGKGNHLIVDGYTDSSEILEDKKAMKKLILDLVDEVGMRVISKPLIVKYESSSNDKTQDGITATVILAESNVTIHTYPKYKFFALDLFSCEEFDIERIIDYLKENIGMVKYKKSILKRGFYGES